MIERKPEDRAEDELEVEAPGTTCVLTDEGWETSDYVDVGDDWTVQPDDSYLSPDGHIRTWPLVGATPDV